MDNNSNMDVLRNHIMSVEYNEVFEIEASPETIINGLLSFFEA